jgi:hypothetical protein
MVYQVEVLARYLQLDDDYSWQALSTCQNVANKEWFFSEYESDEDTAKQVDQLCIHCPVFKECAMSALKNKESGVWAGIYWDGTGKPDKKRNAHKTEEVWFDIRSMLD